jgi:hypothetical protein
MEIKLIETNTLKRKQQLLGEKKISFLYIFSHRVNFSEQSQ